MKTVLFIDRDGTLILEPEDEQIDSLEKLEFFPGVFNELGRIARDMDHELVMVSNQDGLGTPAYPEKDFELVQDKLLRALKKEGIVFDHIHIDPTRPQDQAPTRKPGTGMLKEYLEGGYDLSRSYVIGDRATDIELARNLGTRGILLGASKEVVEEARKQWAGHLDLVAEEWGEVYNFLRKAARLGKVERRTAETAIEVEVGLDGPATVEVSTGLGFFDHMLDQLSRHGGFSLKVRTEGDLQVDEHHTIEDTAIALGEAFDQAVGNKRGVNRYGFCLPMDDSLAQVAVDLGGRNWIEWEADFRREKIGEMPTEMFFHFFKSFSDAARCNLNIKAEGENEHHKIEAIFKAFAKALRMAVEQNDDMTLPSTKGML